MMHELTVQPKNSSLSKRYIQYIPCQLTAFKMLILNIKQYSLEQTKTLKHKYIKKNASIIHYTMLFKIHSQDLSNDFKPRLFL